MTDLIRAAKLWARISARAGRAYCVGRTGDVRVLIPGNRERRGEGEPNRFLLLGDAETEGDRPPATDPAPTSLANPSAPDHDRDPGWRGRPARGEAALAAKGRC